MENSIPDQWKQTVMNVLMYVVKDKLEQLNALEHFDYPIDSLKGAEQLNLKSKRLLYKVKIGSNEIKMSFTASTVLLEPSDGIDFYLNDDYGLWDGDIDENGNITALRFLGKREQYIKSADCEEIVTNKELRTKDAKARDIFESSLPARNKSRRR